MVSLLGNPLYNNLLETVYQPLGYHLMDGLSGSLYNMTRIRVSESIHRPLIEYIHRQEAALDALSDAPTRNLYRVHE